MDVLERQIAALAAAVAQLELALRESQEPAHALGASLTRMGEYFNHFRTGVEADAPAALLLDSCRQAQRELEGCMVSLQFYDRMNQHLSHLRDFMSGLTVVMAESVIGGDAGESWEHLRSKLRTRLISQAQRDLLDLILRPAQGQFVPRAARPQHAEPGSVELF